LAEATGEIEKEENVLIVRRIHVRLRLRADPAQHPTAERVHGFFAECCPVYRSLREAISITTELIFEGV